MVMFSRRPKLVSTAAPLRISYAGGGTDFPDHYLVHGGRVLSTTIDRFVYVNVNRREAGLFNERYRLSYFEAESVQSLDEIRNETARECLFLLRPMFLHLRGSVPRAASLLRSCSLFMSCAVTWYQPDNWPMKHVRWRFSDWVGRSASKISLLLLSVA
jgi:galactokinase/mevalonate kinase-like predicted kinase